MTVFSVRITVFSLDMSNVENFYSSNDFCGERVGWEPSVRERMAMNMNHETSAKLLFVHLPKIVVKF